MISLDLRFALIPFALCGEAYRWLASCKKQVTLTFARRCSALRGRFLSDTASMLASGGAISMEIRLWGYDGWGRQETDKMVCDGAQ